MIILGGNNVIVQCVDIVVDGLYDVVDQHNKVDPLCKNDLYALPKNGLYALALDCSWLFQTFFSDNPFVI